MRVGDFIDYFAVFTPFAAVVIAFFMLLHVFVFSTITLAPIIATASIILWDGLVPVPDPKKKIYKAYELFVGFLFSLALFLLMTELYPVLSVLSIINNPVGFLSAWMTRAVDALLPGFLLSYSLVAFIMFVNAVRRGRK